MNASQDIGTGTPEQWQRVENARRSNDERQRERARVARRDAEWFGTDPSWFGF